MEAKKVAHAEAKDAVSKDLDRSMDYMLGYSCLWATLRLDGA